jgi:hypothetical protein
MEYAFPTARSSINRCYVTAKIMPGIAGIPAILENKTPIMILALLDGGTVVLPRRWRFADRFVSLVISDIVEAAAFQ